LNMHNGFAPTPKTCTFVPHVAATFMVILLPRIFFGTANDLPQSINQTDGGQRLRGMWRSFCFQRWYDTENPTATGTLSAFPKHSVWQQVWNKKNGQLYFRYLLPVSGSGVGQSCRIWTTTRFQNQNYLCFCDTGHFIGSEYQRCLRTLQIHDQLNQPFRP
jgi:hypothetical protein